MPKRSCNLDLGVDSEASAILVLVVNRLGSRQTTCEASYRVTLALQEGRPASCFNNDLCFGLWNLGKEVRKPMCVCSVRSRSKVRSRLKKRTRGETGPFVRPCHCQVTACRSCSLRQFLMKCGNKWKSHFRGKHDENLRRRDSGQRPQSEEGLLLWCNKRRARDGATEHFCRVDTPTPMCAHSLTVQYTVFCLFLPCWARLVVPPTFLDPCLLSTPKRGQQLRSVHVRRSWFSLPFCFFVLIVRVASLSPSMITRASSEWIEWRMSLEACSHELEAEPQRHAGKERTTFLLFSMAAGACASQGGPR